MKKLIVGIASYEVRRQGFGRQSVGLDGYAKTQGIADFQVIGKSVPVL